MTVGYFYKKNVEFAWTGAPLKRVPLKDVVMNLCKLPINHGKHKVGSIWFHTNDKHGVAYKPVSDGIVCCDIDAISKEDCKKIMDNFEKLALVFPCVVCCWYSHSYYDASKPYGGLHLVIKTDKPKLVYDSEDGDYTYRAENIKYSAALAWYIYEVCGIDVRPVFNESLKKTAGIDKAMLSIGQQCFLNYSEITKWNDNLFDVHISPEVVTKLKKYFTGFNWFEVDSDYKIVSCEVKKFNSQLVFADTFKVNNTAFPDNQLGHNRRVAIENFLAGLDWELNDIVEFVVKLCHGNDFRNGVSALRKAIIQTSKVAIRKFRGNPSPHYTERAKYILTELGVDIDIDIKKIYQPIEYDDEFTKLWGEPVVKSDKPIRNVHYNPENYLHLQLNSNQYLMDYKYQITEMITKYQMTYLVADCMVGKTTYALNMQNEYGLFDDDFIVHFKGDTIDVCVPYNSVADNKASSSRKDIKRVKTENIQKFSTEKRNVFIWNTIMPLYEKYFNLGIIKRMVLFFDESQKIVTDDYRWETVFEMFKVLPVMYKHFVFMTGTPAGELDYLTQYFPDYCIIKIDKEEDFKRECKILKYNKFGLGDKIRIIEDVIADGKLPLIYSNSKNTEWKDACIAINVSRVEAGLEPYNILVYDRPNAERLYEVNSTNSIRQYDIVIATKYCSVGIDFQKDDPRMRCSIIDFAGERECTFHDIWQFTLRNRKQDTITKLIVNNNELYNVKLFNYWYYKKLFMDMAKVQTHKMVKPVYEDEQSKELYGFMQEVFRIRAFGKLVENKNNWFDDDKNVTLLGIYFLYRKVFSNIRIIKHMLERRGVKITEIEMTHEVAKMDFNTKKEIYDFFVDNFKEIGTIRLSKGQYDKSSYQIDINEVTMPHSDGVNSNAVEYIEDGKIYSRNVHYMDWLIKQFAGKDEWYDILKERDYMTADTFDAYNRMAMIAKRITKREIDKIKRFRKVMIEDDINDMVTELVYKHYSGVIGITENEIRKSILLSEIIRDYKRILQFSIDNIEFIEEIKNATSDGQRIKACHKMQIAMEQAAAEVARKKMGAAGKKHSKPITVKWKDSGEVITYDSKLELAEALKVAKQNLNYYLKSSKCSVQVME